MVITKEWVIEYLRMKGTKFIIPKEATKIEENAFSDIFGYGNDMQEYEIEIAFEEGSLLEEIETGAFRLCNIVNDVVVPKTVKSVGDFAFYGCEHATFEEGTQIEKRRNGFSSFY